MEKNIVIIFMQTYVLEIEQQNNFERHERLIQDNYGDALLHIVEKA